MKPVRKYGGEKYLQSKPYYSFVGMGYVQLTWEANYRKASQVLGVDFVSNPKLLLEPGYSSQILVRGMMGGWFTAKKLSVYITLQRSDFVNARRIVNGTDKAQEIAALAREYNGLLKADGYGETTLASKPAPQPPAPSPASTGSQGGIIIMALVGATAFILGITGD